MQMVRAGMIVAGEVSMIVRVLMGMMVVVMMIVMTMVTVVVVRMMMSRHLLTPRPDRPEWTPAYR
jgi:heme/copper-type cytochrome/quinol oxidase subunit 2